MAAVDPTSIDIPGLFIFPRLIPSALQDELCVALSSLFSSPSASNQIMLFPSPTIPSSLPPFLNKLLLTLPALLHQTSLPPSILNSLFDNSLPYQCILNLYRPGQGISPHVDLPNRYGNGIIGISLLSSVLFEFEKLDDVDQGKRKQVLLRPGDVYVMTGEARYEWKHGIESREEDEYWDDEMGAWERLRRRTRLSITLRRMLEGADVVGQAGESELKEYHEMERASATELTS